MARSKAATASSQFVRLSSGSRVARRVMPRPANQHVGPAPAHLELEQLLHLVLRPAVRTDNRRRRSSLAAQVVRAAKVRGRI